MKIRLVDQTTYEVESANVVDGHLKIEMKNKTAEEMQDIFSVPANLDKIELLTDEDEVYGEFTGWTKYAGVMLNGELKTAILTTESDDLAKRITTAEANTLAAQTEIQKQAQEIKGIKQEIAEGGAGVDQELFSASVVVARAQAQALTDEQALQAKVLYPTFDELVATGYTAVEKGYKFCDGGNLYKTAQENVTFQVQYRPGEGTESLYTRIDETHAGTLGDPIPWVANMQPEKDKYYIEGELIAKCIEDPGQALHNKLSELCPGRYFEAVE